MKTDVWLPNTETVFKSYLYIYSFNSPREHPHHPSLWEHVVYDYKAYSPLVIRVPMNNSGAGGQKKQGELKQMNHTHLSSGVSHKHTKG